MEPTQPCISPPSPPILGGTRLQNPPELGDLGGADDSNEGRLDLCAQYWGQGGVEAVLEEPR
jgi:hypothetical protein